MGLPIDEHALLCRMPFPDAHIVAREGDLEFWIGLDEPNLPVGTYLLRRTFSLPTFSITSLLG